MIQNKNNREAATKGKRPAIAPTLCGWLLALVGAVSLTVLTAGCFDPKKPEVAFRCGSNGACPDGYECRDDGCCHRIGSPDEPGTACPFGPDSGTDAGDVDADTDASLQDAALVDAGDPDAAPSVSLLSLEPGEATVDVGDTASFTVTLTDVAGPGGLTVFVSVEDDTVASAPSTLDVEEGSDTTTLQVEGLAPGVSGVDVTLGNTLRTSINVASTTAAAGDVILTEFVALPHSGGATMEMFEVLNDSTVPLNLAGWAFSIGGADESLAALTTPGDPVYLFPGEMAYGVANPSNPADIPGDARFVYGAAGAATEIPDTGALLSLSDGATVIDEVDCSGLISDPSATLSATAFPALEGRSTQLDPDCTDTVSNDAGSCWCVPATPTPGMMNPTCGEAIINEVLVDPTGPDEGSEFVELLGTPGASLASFVLRAAAPDGTLVGLSLVFTAAHRIPLDGYLVVGDDTGGATSVANVDVETSTALDNSGGALQLLDAGGAILDALGYGALTSATDSSQGLPLVETALSDTVSVLEGASMSRDATGSDTDDNDSDFFSDPTPTPGQPYDG